jgi:Silicon transporter
VVVFVISLLDEEEDDVSLLDIVAVIICDTHVLGEVFDVHWILGLSFAVTLTALFNGQTKMYTDFPSAVSVILFFVLMGFVGMMEGIQISFFAVVNLTSEELKNDKIFAANCEIASVERIWEHFLIGRQICVTCCMFVVARITTLDVDAAAGDPTIVGVNSGA